MKLSEALEIQERFNNEFKHLKYHCFLSPKDISLSKYIGIYSSDKNYIRTDLINNSTLDNYIKINGGNIDIELHCFEYNLFDIDKSLMEFYPINDFIKRKHLLFRLDCIE